MSNRRNDTLGGNLSFTASCPLHLEVIADYPAAGDLQVHYAANDKLLKASNALQEHIIDTEDYAELAPEFARLDNKVNMILELLSLVIAEQIQLPPSHTVQMSAVALAVHSSLSFSPGEKVSIGIYFEPTIPRPLQLFGEVMAVDEWVTDIKLDSIPASMADGLEKLVFRRHRREVAARS